MRIALEDPGQAEVIELIAELDAYQDTLYPAEARYALDLSSLSSSDLLFAVARGDDGTAFGCGAIVLGPNHGEVKRMYVRPEARGSGAAGRILRILEAGAIDRGCRVLMLETGPRQAEALAFYARHGFSECGPFGDYPAHPLSVFLRKDLTQASAKVIPTLPSRSLPATQAFYARLGFEGDQIHDGYAILERGPIELHFFTHPELQPDQCYSGCYIRMEGVDALHAQFLAAQLPSKGIPRLEPVEDKPWGMREFALLDGDGNLLKFGKVL